MKAVNQFDVDATIARLKAVVEAFEAMGANERLAALYYVTARLYGNRYGDQVLRVLPSPDTD